jgi:hypothetical protein
MQRIVNSIAVCLMVAVCSVGCSGRSSINDQLIVSANVLSDEIYVEMSRNLSFRHAAKTCIKYSKSPEVQCGEFLKDLARSTALLCGLKVQRDVLNQIIENRDKLMSENFERNEFFCTNNLY